MTGIGAVEQKAIPYDSKEIMWWLWGGLVSQPRPFGTWRMTNTEMIDAVEQKGSGGVVINEPIALVQISTQR